MMPQPAKIPGPFDGQPPHAADDDDDDEDTRMRGRPGDPDRDLDDAVDEHAASNEDEGEEELVSDAPPAEQPDEHADSPPEDGAAVTAGITSPDNNRISFHFIPAKASPSASMKWTSS